MPKKPALCHFSPMPCHFSPVPCHFFTSVNGALVVFISMYLTVNPLRCNQLYYFTNLLCSCRSQKANIIITVTQFPDQNLCQSNGLIILLCLFHITNFQVCYGFRIQISDLNHSELCKICWLLILIFLYMCMVAYYCHIKINKHILNK